jgi:hypothetical protein
MPKLNLQQTPEQQAAALEDAASQTSYLSDDDVSIDFDDNGQLQLVDNRKPEDKKEEELKVNEDSDSPEDSPDPVEARFSKIEETLNKTLDAITKLAEGKSPTPAKVQEDQEPSLEGLDLNDPQVFMKYLTDTIDHRISKVIRPYEAGFKEMDVKQQLQHVYNKFGPEVVKKENTDRMSVLIVNNPGMTVEQAWHTIQALDKSIPKSNTPAPSPKSKEQVLTKQKNLALDSDRSVGGGTPVPKNNGKKMTIEQATEAAIAEVLGRSN